MPPTWSKYAQYTRTILSTGQWAVIQIIERGPADGFEPVISSLEFSIHNLMLKRYELCYVLSEKTNPGLDWNLETKGIIFWELVRQDNTFVQNIGATFCSALHSVLIYCLLLVHNYSGFFMFFFFWHLQFFLKVI